MAQHDEPTNDDYPRGRGYGHDYMRGGEVFGGYGYSEREEYERRRGELSGGTAPDGSAADLGRPNESASHTPDRGT
jgi:hypothetical protein